MKKVFCILLSLLLVICVIPFASAAQRPDYSMFVNGYEDADYTAPALSGGKASNRGTSALPESFSMKDLLPEARVQGEYGSCWAFSTIGAAEANIIKKGLADREDLDLSELQFIHYAYGKPVDPLGNFTGDYAFRTDGDLMNGGNFVYACNAVARWTAFTDEAAMPYADAEFAREHSYADEFAIDPEVHTAWRTTEVCDDLLAFPVGWNVDFMTIITYPVLLQWDERRIVLKPAFPGIADVDIEGVAVSVELPVSRDGHLTPACIAVLQVEEIQRPLVSVL